MALSKTAGGDGQPVVVCAVRGHQHRIAAVGSAGLWAAVWGSMIRLVDRMKSVTKLPKKRIYRAAGTSYELEIQGNDGEVIGQLKIDLNALNALEWRRK